MWVRTLPAIYLLLNVIKQKDPELNLVHNRLEPFQAKKRVMLAIPGDHVSKQVLAT